MQQIVWLQELARKPPHKSFVVFDKRLYICMASFMISLSPKLNLPVVKVYKHPGHEAWILGKVLALEVKGSMHVP